MGRPLKTASIYSSWRIARNVNRVKGQLVGPPPFAAASELFMVHSIGKRITLHALDDGVGIIIKAPRRTILVILLILWGLLWLVAGALAIVNMFTTGGLGSQLFAVVWFFFWLTTLVLASAQITWQVVGKEVIFVRGQTLNMRKTVHYVVSDKSFPMTDITNLRATGEFLEPFSARSTWSLWGVSGGSVAFDTPEGTERFGIGLNEADAQALVSALTPYLKQPV